MGRIKDLNAHIYNTGGPTSVIGCLNQESNFNYSHDFNKDEQLTFMKRIAKISDADARDLLLELFSKAESLKSRSEASALIAKKVAKALTLLDESLDSTP